MTKITLTNLANLQNETTAVNAINNNNAVLSTAFDNTLSRNGISPNQMSAALDMNSNRIINLPAPISVNEPARLTDLNGVIGGGTITFNSIPTGGTTGQFLEKNSNTNFDAIWANVPNSLPTGGASGQVLEKNSGTDYDTSWQTLPVTHSVPAGGLVSQVLAKNSSTDYDASWANQALKTRAVLNILDFGGVSDGITDNLAAFNLAYAALPVGGGAIYFPAGTYLFSAGISKTYPSTRFSLTLMGDGSNNTILTWPNANGGFTFTNSSLIGSIHVRGLMLTTSQVSSGTAFQLVGTNLQINAPWSDFIDVIIQGDDYSGLTTNAHCWGNGILTQGWSAINFYNLNTNGLFNPAPGNAGGGVGVGVGGNVGLAVYGILYNFTSCSFNSHTTGLLYGDYVQGVSVSGCNFNGAGIGTAIATVTTPVATLSQLAINNSQFNYGSASGQIIIHAMNDCLIADNVITAYSTNGIGLSIQGSSGFQITGNFFDLFGSNVSTFGVVTNSQYGTITGNTFETIVGVNLQASSTGVVMIGNAFYPSTTTKFINNGTSATPGTASP